jgi:hypothetical protein
MRAPCRKITREFGQRVIYHSSSGPAMKSCLIYNEVSRWQSRFAGRGMERAH